jgi:hypothetical protein
MVVEALRRRDLPGRALVRREDERADALRALGAEVVVGDLTRAEDSEQWRDQELRLRNLPDHLFERLLTMARLHAANRYDRLTHDVQAITGRPATSCRDFVSRHAELFRPNTSLTNVSGAL